MQHLLQQSAKNAAWLFDSVSSQNAGNAANQHDRRGKICDFWGAENDKIELSNPKRNYEQC
jgi:hypothetical protein